MKRILVRIKTPTGEKAREMTIPVNLAIADFLPAIARRLGLQTERGGQPIHYQLIHDETGQRFLATDMLEPVIAPNDLLSVQPISTRHNAR